MQDIKSHSGEKARQDDHFLCPQLITKKATALAVAFQEDQA